jgi:hypothetical protein
MMIIPLDPCGFCSRWWRLNPRSGTVSGVGRSFAGPCWPRQPLWPAHDGGDAWSTLTVVSLQHLKHSDRSDAFQH